MLAKALRRLPATSLRGDIPCVSRLTARLRPSPKFAIRQTKATSTTAGPSLFSGKGTMWTLETDSDDRVAALLDHHGLTKWGFVVYRCTYDNENDWAQFMNALTDRAVGGLDDSDDLTSRLDWSVQEDAAALEGATKDEVRRRFRRLVTSTLIPAESVVGEASDIARDENPRWNYCIHADAAAVHSVLYGGPEPVTPLIGPPYSRSKARYVNLIRADNSWQNPDFDRFDWASYTGGSGREEEEYDDLKEEIEGSRLADVGWMKVSLDNLFSEVYEKLMQNHLWDSMYRRPPQIMGF